ncbi:uncharacterized protein WCC33_004382 [Rhinophrynus dorsalis]
MMWSHLTLSALLNLWLAVSFSSSQSGDEALADLGSGYIIDALRDQPKEPPSYSQDTNHCQFTFVTPPRDQYSCPGKETSLVLEKDVEYLKGLLQDSNRVLQSLKYTVNAEAQDLSYQEVISEYNKGIREDNKEFYGVLDKVMHELQTHIDDEGPDITDEKKKLKKSFHMMAHLLHTTSVLAEKLGKTSEDLDSLLEKTLDKSTTLAYRSTIKS